MKPQFFNNQAKFRIWFIKNYNKKSELLVGFYKKNSGMESITWEESVDEALCFGWIDGIRKSIDEISYTIRFTPRKNGSNWSTKNINRVKELISSGLMHSEGLKVFKSRKEDKRSPYSFEQRIIKLDTSFEKKFKMEIKAWQFFNSQVPSYKNPSIHWIMSAKQEKTRLKRLDTLIKCSESHEFIPPMKWGNIKLAKAGKE